MANAASKTLAALVTAEERDAGLLFPSVTRLRSVSYRGRARRRARGAYAKASRDDGRSAIEQAVKQSIWDPDYPSFEPL